MLASVWMLAAGLSLNQVPPPSPPVNSGTFHVDCRVEGALERALSRAEKVDHALIELHGVCAGSYVIHSGDISLWGATPDSGLAGAGPAPTLTILEGRIGIHQMTIRDGVVGVVAEGWNATVVLDRVDVVGHEVGVVASRGGTARVLDSTVRDGQIGVEAQYSASANLQNVTISGQDNAVIAWKGSEIAVNQCTIVDNREVGVAAQYDSQVLLYGGSLLNNGGVHVISGDRSDVSLASAPIVGSDTDETEWSFGVFRHSSISTFSTPAIHGNIYAFDGGSLRLGNTTLDGGVMASEFSDVFLSSSEVTGGVSCASGSDAVCVGVTSPGAMGCASASCGTMRESDRQVAMPEPPSFAGRAIDTPGARRGR